VNSISDGLTRCLRMQIGAARSEPGHCSSPSAHRSLVVASFVFVGALPARLELRNADALRECGNRAPALAGSYSGDKKPVPSRNNVTRRSMHS